MPSNFHVILLSRPGVNGEPSEDNFKYEECPYPADPEPDEVLIQTLYLSVDPAMRCRMNEDTGAEYLSPWQLNQTVDGFAGVGVVVKSGGQSFEPGDIVHLPFGWPWMAFIKKKSLELQKVDKNLVGSRPSLLLTIFGLIGTTSHLGILEKGHIKQNGNQTMVISGAAGACGSLAGQIGRLLGCARVVGICGTEEKCQYLTQDLGFDGAINYKKEDVADRLSQLCPSGVDAYFDNVGGEISNTVIRQMNKNSHVILCGQIAVYNKDVPYPPPIPEDITEILKNNNVTRERFLVLNYQEKFEESIKQLAEWVMQGKLKVRETIAEGLENAGNAFVSMMRGGNIGKQIVHVADV